MARNYQRLDEVISRCAKLSAVARNYQRLDGVISRGMELSAGGRKLSAVACSYKRQHRVMSGYALVMSAEL
ncbi:hypothetical protein MKY41_11005 [Sporosarcina sp. FSL W7-1349]|uniref:hypothetical protein n=1 Tax=Sporosarcina sp. FSL W7-1349 TaxID=2921561 RepID=UPI0030F55A6E